MPRPLKVGAVMYDPKVSVIWEIIRDFFDAQGAPIDPVFYGTYEAQVDALLHRAIGVGVEAGAGGAALITAVRHPEAALVERAACAVRRTSLVIDPSDGMIPALTPDSHHAWL